jgi:hypothetical protein
VNWCMWRRTPTSRCRMWGTCALWLPALAALLLACMFSGLGRGGVGDCRWLSWRRVRQDGGTQTGKLDGWLRVLAVGGCAGAPVPREPGTSTFALHLRTCEGVSSVEVTDGDGPPVTLAVPRTGFTPLVQPRTWAVGKGTLQHDDAGHTCVCVRSDCDACRDWSAGHTCGCPIPQAPVHVHRSASSGLHGRSGDCVRVRSDSRCAHQHHGCISGTPLRGPTTKTQHDICVEGFVATLTFPLAFRPRVRIPWPP